MLWYLNIMNGIIVPIFIVSVVGLIYSLIRKKPKMPWFLGILSSIVLIVSMVLFDDLLLDKIDRPEEEIEDTSEDPSGTVRIKEGKYIVGSEVKEGVFDLTFQYDSGSFEVSPLDMSREFSDITFFGENKKFRIYLAEGDGLDIKSGIAIITPADETIKPYEETEITAGIWVAGLSLSPGKYKVGKIQRPGNIAQYSNQKEYVMSDILNEDIVIDLLAGDYIIINGTALTLVPTISQ